MWYELIDVRTMLSTFIGGVIGGAGTGVGAYLVVNHLLKRIEKKLGGRAWRSSRSSLKSRR